MRECETAGKQMYRLAEEIFPIFRCLTGKGVRDTLAILNDYYHKATGYSFEIKEIASGTPVFDWKVPKEWIIREAYIEDENGEHIVDIKDNNLHVVGYSIPVDRWVDLEELNQYIYTLPKQPDLIPYVTSYYFERYGFCMSQQQKESLKQGMYHLYIDSELIDGNLTYAECVLPGEKKDEIVFESYVCHPSMANNEVSGLVTLIELAKQVTLQEKRKYTYRFLILPETIGAISYLATDNNLERMKKFVKAGVVLTCVGDNGDYSIVHSRYGDNYSEKVLSGILRMKKNFKEYSFLERGSDERQYCAPGVDLPFSTFSRTKFYEYPEYHTSGDNMSIISEEGLQGSLDVLLNMVDVIEIDDMYKLSFLCEPQLGKRGLYPTLSQKDTYDWAQVYVDFLAYCDGKNDLIDISKLINVDVVDLIPLVRMFQEGKLI